MRSATWWGRRVDPERWFTADQLDRSRRYHGPLAAAAIWRTTARAVGLVLVFLVARENGAITDPRGFIGMGVVIAIVLWIPSAVAEAWSAFRHEPRFDGIRVEARRFVMSLVAVGGLVVAGSVSLILLFRWLEMTTSWWPVVVLVGSVAATTSIGPWFVAATNRFDPLPVELDLELSSIAAAAGVPGVRFGRLDSRSGERGLNALTLGLRSPSLVLCTPELLEADAELREFVVAHELAHVRRRHHRSALVVSVIGSSIELGALWLASIASPTDQWFDLGDARSLPLVVGLVGAVGLVSGSLEAWVSRAHERQADVDALAGFGSPGESSMRQLVQNERSDLAPSRLARWFAPHPSPAERLAQSVNR